MSRRTVEQRFWPKVAITADDNQCWLWTAFCNTRDYGWFRHNGKSVRAHRVAWMMPDYVIPDGMEICHSCDNPRCCNPKHLFLGTHQENMDDMWEKGRSRIFKGEQVSISKLTETQVIEIRSRWIAGGIHQHELATEYNVSLSTVHNLIVRRTWKHI